MHTLTLVFSLCLGMVNYAGRMHRLCWFLEHGFPSAPGITVSMEYHGGRMFASSWIAWNTCKRSIWSRQIFRLSVPPFWT